MRQKAGSLRSVLLFKFAIISGRCSLENTNSLYVPCNPGKQPPEEGPSGLVDPPDGRQFALRVLELEQVLENELIPPQRALAHHYVQGPLHLRRGWPGLRVRFLKGFRDIRALVLDQVRWHAPKTAARSPQEMNSTYQVLVLGNVHGTGTEKKKANSSSCASLTQRTGACCENRDFQSG